MLKTQTNLPTIKAPVSSGSIVPKLPSAAGHLSIAVDALKAVNGVVEVFKEREKTKQIKATTKAQTAQSNNQRDVALAQIKAQEKTSELSYKQNCKQLDNEMKSINKKFKKDKQIIKTIKFAIENQASQETINLLIDKI